MASASSLYGRAGGILAGLSAAAALTVGGCQKAPSGTDANGTQLASAGAPAGPGGGGAGCGTAPTLSYTVSMNTGASQADIDCFAWQAFLALNWTADPNNPGYPDKSVTASAFGTPGDTKPAVWETYAEATAVFGKSLGAWTTKRPAMLTLSRLSKFGPLDLSDIVQAGKGDHWVTNQRGDLTFYELLMNKDEYEFITKQPKFDLTTAAGQLACAQQPGKVISDGPPSPTPPKGPLRGGLVMPEGVANGWRDSDCEGNPRNFGDGVGAMEIKASWTPLPADHSLDYRYKTAQATIVDPVTKKTKSVTVGLVGLHIAWKRFGRHQWTWATFEQVDNTPDEGGPNGWTAPNLPANANRKPAPGFTYFNPKCDKNADKYYHCVHNAPPTPCPPQPGGTCQPYNAPMQITRLRPVDATANQVNGYVWGLLPAKSVFNYYRLIDVQWPQKPQLLPPGQKTPLPKGDQIPVGGPNNPAQTVSNATLETFQQNKAACMDCHVFAPIASAKTLQATAPGGLKRLTKADITAQPYASDYSFLFIAETKK